MSTVPKKQQEKQQITAAPDIFLSLQTSTKSIKNLPTITKIESHKILKVPLLKLNLHRRTLTDKAEDTKGIL